MGVTAVAGEREVVFSWSPPPVTERNGVITSYTLSCSPSPSSLPQSPSSGPLTVAGFSPHTSYSCSLVGSNTQGSGPPELTSFTTLQDCEALNDQLFPTLKFYLFYRFFFPASFQWSFQQLCGGSCKSQFVHTQECLFKRMYIVLVSTCGIH